MPEWGFKPKFVEPSSTAGTPEPPMIHGERVPVSAPGLISKFGGIVVVDARQNRIST